MQAAVAPCRAASATPAGAARRRHIVTQCAHGVAAKPQLQQPEQQWQQQAAGSRRALLGLGAALLAAQIAPARAEEPVSIAQETEVGDLGLRCRRCCRRCCRAQVTHARSGLLGACARCDPLRASAPRRVVLPGAAGLRTPPSAETPPAHPPRLSQVPAPQPQQPALPPMKSLRDDTLAYEFEYPAETASGKPLPLLVSRKPERYSSAAPLTADARQHIVCELADLIDAVTVSVTVRGCCSGRLI